MSDLESGKKIRVLKLGGCSGKSNPKCQDLPKFQFSGVGMGGCSGTRFEFRGKLGNLVKNFWKPSLPLHHR